ncbi:hypothetical protein AMECASPLE_017263 [Ameca splendens]|uniref:Secreted protein n=1 Tax=Ameca splendens TaxID=208324 RepID=A0ABV0ZY69_9TELE
MELCLHVREWILLPLCICCFLLLGSCSQEGAADCTLDELGIKLREEQVSLPVGHLAARVLVSFVRLGGGLVCLVFERAELRTAFLIEVFCFKCRKSSLGLVYG